MNFLKFSSVFLLESDLCFGDLLERYLVQQGVKVDRFFSLSEIQVNQIQTLQYDVFILGCELSNEEWAIFCQHLRNKTLSPLLVVTSNRSIQEQLKSLTVGADDCLIKPIDPQRIYVRLQAIYRLHQRALTEKYKLFKNVGFQVNIDSKKVEYKGQLLDLTTLEFELLLYLINHAGKVVSRNDLSLAIRGIPYDILDRSIDMRISKIRKKLGDCSKPHEIIKTVWQKGYMLCNG